jgi:hypothetical protein
MTKSAHLKLQRTGKTEGCLIFNHFLKKKHGIDFSESEDLFINWLYTTAGMYDRDVFGSEMDIDTKAVKNSEIYQRWLEEYTNSLYNTVHSNIIYHKYYFPGVSIYDFEDQFPQDEKYNHYWTKRELLEPFLKGRVLIINPFAEIIAYDYPEYNIIPQTFPYTFFNSGPDKNFYETLDRIYSEVNKDFDNALISIGGYGCIMADRLSKFGNVATVGGGIHELFPVKEIPKSLLPDGYEKIDDGKYWKGIRIC